MKLVDEAILGNIDHKLASSMFMVGPQSVPMYSSSGSKEHIWGFHSSTLKLILMLQSASFSVTFLLSSQNWYLSFKIYYDVFCVALDFKYLFQIEMNPAFISVSCTCNSLPIFHCFVVVAHYKLLYGEYFLITWIMNIFYLKFIWWSGEKKPILFWGLAMI